MNRHETRRVPRNLGCCPVTDKAIVVNSSRRGATSLQPTKVMATNQAMATQRQVMRQELVTRLGAFVGAWKWHGGVVGLDGRVYCVPCSGNAVLVVDPVLGTAETFGNVGGTQAYKWNRAAVASDGTIFAMPSHHPAVLVIDPKHRTVELMGHHQGSGSKWNHAVASIDGKVYGLPFDASTLLVVDPATRTSREVGDFGKGKYKWRVGLLAPDDGRIFGIPYNAANVLVIDAAGGTTLLPLPPSIADQPAKWNGCVLGADGALYGIPCDASAVLRIDPRTDAVELFGDVGRGRSKWRNGVLDPRTGRIFGVPFDASAVLVIEPVGRQVQVIGALGSQRGKWADGALGGDGRVYACPHTSTSVLVIDPSTLTCDLVHDIADDLPPSSDSKMCGKYVECLPCGGAVVGVPVHASSAMLLTPRSPSATMVGSASATEGAACAEQVGPTRHARQDVPPPALATSVHVRQSRRG